MIRLFETRGPLYRKAQKDGRSNHLQMMQVGPDPCDDYGGNLVVQGSLEDEIVREQNRLGRAKSQGQSGTREVATAQVDRSCGCWADADDLDHVLCLCLDHGLTLGPYASRCRGGHAHGQRSTGLLAQDSYGT